MWGNIRLYGKDNPCTEQTLTPSILWLLLLTLVSIGYAIWLFKHSDYSTWETILYIPVFLVGRMLWRVSFTNSAPEALKQGAILAANHRSSVDPFFVQLAARRRVHWMVAREFCEHFIFGKVLKPFMVIPTNRSGLDLNSTKLAIQFAQEGRLVGMFPEGKINITSAPLLPIRGGAAMVAIKTGVPVIPLYIEGSPYCRTVWSPILMPARVRITFGEPIYPRLTSSAQNGNGLAIADLESTAESDSSATDSAQLQLQDLILRWGEQVVAMSGHSSDFQVQLGTGSRKRRQLRTVG
ncbi:MAG: lysophospholipid acyltransferase family protein [Pirellulales bacterium]